MSVILGKNLILSPGFGEGRLSPNAPFIGWRSFVTIDTIVADFEDENYPVANLANESTALEWRSSTTGDQYITINIPEGEEVDYVALATHNLSTAGTQVSIEVLVGEDDWEEVAVGQPPNNGPVIFRFELIGTPQVRVRLRGSMVPPTISVLYVGPLLYLPRNIYVGHSPINYARNTRVSSGKNERGDFLGRIVTQRSKSSELNMGNLPPDWFREFFEPFMVHAEEFPFFFAWRPRDYPFEIGYIWTTDDISSANQLPNGFMEFNMSFAGIAGRAGLPMVPRDRRWVLETGYWSKAGYWRTDVSW